MTDELDRLPTDQRQRFLQIPSTISVVCSQGCPNYPKYKFAISLQYLNKELSYEVDFLHADKHENLLQIDSMILMVMVNIPKVPKIASLKCLKNISKIS